MVYVTRDIAFRMESCIKQSHIEVTRQYPHGQILEIGGGAACFSGFDSFLSQVVGWGFLTKPKHYQDELEELEHFYHSLNHRRIDIELCPFTGNHLTEFLSKKNYLISELNNVSFLDLTQYSLKEINEDQWVIREVKDNEIESWASRVAMGFGFLEAKDQFTHYARAKGVTAFAVYNQDEIVAGATIALHGDVCDLGVTSTLPLFRGKGLQKKLVIARLNFAMQCNAVLATVTTEPGTISDLNAQKSGFKCAYTRIKLTKKRIRSASGT